MTKILFFSTSILERTSLWFPDQGTRKENVLSAPNSLVGQYLHQLSLVQSSKSIQRMQTVPWPKHFFYNFRKDQSLLCRPRNSGRECAWWTNFLVGQYLHQLSLVQSSRSIQRMQTVVAKTLLFSDFRMDQSLLHRPTNSGRECAWWTNSLVGQYLHQLSLVQSSRFIQHMQTVLWPKQFFLLLQF